MPVNAQSNWDLHWSLVQKADFFYDFLQKEQVKLYLQLIKNRIGPHSKILEIGAGSGKLTAALCEKFSCSAVIVDSSPEAKRFFERKNASGRVKFMLADAFKLKFSGKFDLVFSDGLIEHFVGQQQKDLISVHARAAKKNGFVIFFVPHKTAVYKMFKFAMRVLGLWNFGFERPYTREELIAQLKENDLEVLDVACGFWEVGAICRKAE